MDPLTIMAIGGGLGSLLGGLFGGNDNDAPERESYQNRIARIEQQRANELKNARESQGRTQGYLNQIPGTLGKHYSPYEEMGRRAYPQLESQYAQLLNSPEGLLNQIGGGHRASPGYQFKTDEATKAANQAAAAGGMLGSPSHQQSLAKTVTGLADQDYYNYLQNALGLYGAGLSGLGGLNSMGYDAASNLGAGESNALLSQANLSHAAGMNEGMINRNANESYDYAQDSEDMRNRRRRETEDMRNKGMWGSLGTILGQVAGGTNMFSNMGNSFGGSSSGGNAFGGINPASFFGGGGSSGTSRPDAFWTSRNVAPQSGYYGNAYSQMPGGMGGNAFNQAQSSFRW